MLKIKPVQIVKMGLDESLCVRNISPPRASHLSPLTFSMQLVGGTLPIMRMKTVCVKAEQKRRKAIGRDSKDFLPSKLLEGGKLVVVVASVVCVVSHHYPRFLASCKNTVVDCWFFQILSCIVPSVELVQQVW